MNQLADVLRDTKEIEKIALNVFLDIEGAFDSTSHARIRYALIRKGVADTLD